MRHNPSSPLPAPPDAPPIPCHVLQWRSPQMSGIAFWYFETSEEAELAREELQPGCESRIVHTWIDARSGSVIRHG